MNPQTDRVVDMLFQINQSIRFLAVQVSVVAGMIVALILTIGWVTRPGAGWGKR